ncbi:MAG: PAS domain S-box protein [Deltaproteobacteria bacterium]|nr:PAS domain S-box protein [Candidatus Deferrimicrobiaceae bacterium]
MSREADSSPPQKTGIPPEDLERLRTVFDLSGDAIFILDDEAHVIEVNQVACGRYGYTRDEMRRLHIRDIDTPDQASEIPVRLEKLQRGGSAFFEALHQAKDGRLLPTEVNARFIRQGDASFIICIFRDLTERKKVEEALREREKELEEAQRVAHVGSWKWETKTDTVTWSEELYRIAGRDPRSKAPSFATELSACYTPESWARLQLLVADALKTGAPYEGDLEVVRPDGTTRWTAVSGEAVRDDGGRLTGLRGTVHDITERKKLQEQVCRSQKMEAVGKLAGGIAHEFNNLMTVVTGYCELLLAKRSPDDPDRHAIEEIEKAGDQATLLTRQLLAFSRKQILQPKVISLNEIVYGIETMLERMIGKDIALKTVIDANLWKVRVDPLQIEQVILNFAINSRDAMPNGGSFCLSTANAMLDASFANRFVGAKTGPYVVLTVQDTGCGMEETTISRLFEPFFTTKETGRGAGLGMPMVYGIVKQSGGYIDVESEVEKGTTFRVYFPRAVEEPMEARGAESPADPLAGTEVILVVEDEKAVRDLVEQVLFAKGYRVLSAADGNQGLRIIKEIRGPIDLLITDALMSGMSGKELSERMALLHPGMKVLFISGYTRDAIVQQGILPIGAAFVQKPFKIGSLVRKVREVLDSESVVH